jgi:hypothetical protein
MSPLQHRIAMLAALLLISASPITPASAQTLYRCGNTYQDKPCTGEPGKVVVEGDSVPAASSAPARPVDDFCKQQGNAAALLRWEKEGGRTVEEQVRRDPNNGSFIRYVYAKRGSALDVRRLVERDCMDTGASKQQSGPAASPGVGGFLAAQPRSEPPPQSSSASTQPDEPRRGGGIGRSGSAEQSSRSNARNVDATFCRSLFEREKKLIEQRMQFGAKPIPETLSQQLREVADQRKAANCPASPI